MRFTPSELRRLGAPEWEIRRLWRNQWMMTLAQMHMAQASPHLIWVTIGKRLPIPKGLRRKVAERDGWRCKYCGKELLWATLTIDHVKAVSRFGDNKESNLVAACRPCNARKKNRDVVAFLGSSLP